MSKLYFILVKMFTFLCNEYSRIHTYKRLMNERKSLLIKQFDCNGGMSKQQKNEIKNFFKGERFLFDGHEINYIVNKEFSVSFFPEDLFRLKYESKLNDKSWANVCYDKNTFEKLLPKVRFPKTIVRSMECFLYDDKYNVIDVKNAKNLLEKYDKVVFKPSDAWAGRGVCLMSPKDVPLLEEKNFVVQELIIQDNLLSRLNESSVNIVRMITLLKDSEVILLSASLRIGGKGQFTDNASTPDGKGMIVIGIDEEGKLRENGYYSSALPTKTNADGIKFKGITIPKYFEMIEIAKKNHPLLPKLRFLGWDFTVDSEGNVLVMEVNPKYPGVFYYQLANGPLFGSRTKEIYEWMKKL